MRILVVPILKNRWAYYCHSTLPSTSKLTRLVNWTSSKWENIGDADPSSWKGKLFKTGNNFMDRMDYQEWFLKGVPIKEDLEHELTKVRFKTLLILGLCKRRNRMSNWIICRCLFIILPHSIARWLNNIFIMLSSIAYHIIKSTCIIRLIGCQHHFALQSSRSFRISHWHTTRLDCTVILKVRQSSLHNIRSFNPYWI